METPLEEAKKKREKINVEEEERKIMYNGNKYLVYVQFIPIIKEQ